jgi:hypothetical protein
MTEQLAQRWTGFWNGATDSGPDLLAPDFRIHFGEPGPLLDPDAIVGPQMMTDLITAYRAHYPEPRFVVDEVLPAPQGFAMRWTVTMDDNAVSGIDVAHVTDGRLTEVWSVTAPRAL